VRGKAGLSSSYSCLKHVFAAGNLLVNVFIADLFEIFFKLSNILTSTNHRALTYVVGKPEHVLRSKAVVPEYLLSLCQSSTWCFNTKVSLASEAEVRFVPPLPPKNIVPSRAVSVGGYEWAYAVQNSLYFNVNVSVVL
jgi:hypothetical protein